MTPEQYAAHLRRQRAPHGPKPPKPPPCQSEAALLRQVRQWLTLHRVFHVRINAGGGKRGKRVIKGAPEGTPDLILCIEGRFIGLELKREGGRERPAQRAWRERAEAEGKALCLVIHSLEELVAALAAEGVT